MRIRNYKRPDLPAVFYLVDGTGLSDGPYAADDLRQTEFPGKPWAIQNGGSPKVFRLKKQKGDKLVLEDGDVTVVPVRV